MQQLASSNIALHGGGHTVYIALHGGGHTMYIALHGGGHTMYIALHGGGHTMYIALHGGGHTMYIALHGGGHTMYIALHGGGHTMYIALHGGGHTMYIALHGGGHTMYIAHTCLNLSAYEVVLSYPLCQVAAAWQCNSYQLCASTLANGLKCPCTFSKRSLHPTTSYTPLLSSMKANCSHKTKTIP